MVKYDIGYLIYLVLLTPMLISGNTSYPLILSSVMAVYFLSEIAKKLDD